MLVVDVAVDQWHTVIEDEEEGYRGKDQSHDVTRQAYVDHPVALKGAKGVPKAPVVGFACEGGLLFAEAWDLHVDSGAQLGLHLEALDHLDHLALLLVDLRKVGADLPQVLVDVVLHSFFFSF